MTWTKNKTTQVPDTVLDASFLRALDVLEGGGLILLPVDTLYGVAARADCADAVYRLQHLKHRDPAKPLAILCADFDQLITNFMPDTRISGLLQLLLPGPVTAVIPAGGPFCSQHENWRESVGLRIPGTCSSTALLKQLPWPLALSSANFSGQKSAGQSSELDPEFCAGLNFRLNGAVVHQCASTVVDLRCEPPKILRSGVLKESELTQLLENA